MIEFKGKRIHTAIFDMDGTMFDTERLRFETIRQASIEIYGTPIRDETLMGSLGLSAVRAEALAREQNGDDFPYKAIRKRADELELAHVRKHGVPVKHGLMEVLERLRRSGLSMAVATSSRRAIAEEYLINANVLKYFDITVCGDEVKRGKPHPDIFLRAARELNNPPASCLIMEDSENGLLAASEAGGLPILIKDIKAPREDVRRKAFQSYDSMLDFLDELSACTPLLPPPRLTEPLPTTLNHTRVGIHGFGAMGGGYLTQILSHWDGYTRPKEIIATTGNAVLRELVNAFGKFSTRYATPAFDQTIEHIRLIDIEDHEAVRSMYATAEIVGLCLPEHAVRQQAPLIASGLLARHERNGKELVVLTVLNKIAGSRFVRKCVQEALAEQVTPELCEEIMRKTQFPETVVNRIVSKLPRENLLRQARIKLGVFEKHVRAGKRRAQAVAVKDVENGVPSQLAQYAEKFRQASITANALGHLNLILFHSEPDMLLYAERCSPLLTRLRQVKTVEDIGQIQTIKNRLWNGTHAIVAWYAYLLGYQTLGQGMGDERVAALMDSLIKHEIEPAMLRENPAIEPDVSPFIQTFIARCKTSYRDPCVRVGRDPLRKLQRKERVFGNIELARKHGLRSDALEFGAALGMLYAIRVGAPVGKESQIIRDVYARRESVADVLAFEGSYNGQPYPGLDRAADAALIERIAGHFRRLLDPDSDHWSWPLRYLDTPQEALLPA
ncbi:bifunctional mannitol-1-phosphate dehydrogenase/phosphatase [Dyella sp. A6]|uniref:bifunctional mannitol-1-phosphate dehydrogenase/phosphatase n=1 Tax=Dyella aluminiiresistens TaxID=3069105 RepID=UPI002E771B98|nr:HAD-IA family hydrolase [Dyella sp. A6]